MRYRYNLILFLLMIACAAPALAQDTRYRVEILVLRQLEHNEEAQERLHLPDYSGATDFLTPAAREDEETEADAQEADVEAVNAEGVTPEAAESVLSGAGSDEEKDTLQSVDVPDPNRLVHREEMSSVMQDTWRRLRLSGPYRPEQYLSWEQGSDEPFPLLRLHDLDVVMIDDPWAEYRTETEIPDRDGSNTAQSTLIFGDAAGLDRSGELEGPMLPDPVYYYRLDGTVMLKRTRFLHLELDLQMREPVLLPEPLTAPVTGEESQHPVLPASFLVYELKQSRQVRTGRMEYFDGPVLGVLAFITEIEEQSGNTP